MKEVLAVVVTFNRPSILHNCLTSLYQQQYPGLKIHVVVNSSDSATRDVIESFRNKGMAISFACFDNVGPAGGFYYGLKRFLEGTCEYVWLMDDDIIAEPDCLSQLLKYIEPHRYVFPRVLKHSGEEVVSFGWWGILLARSVIEKAGLPMEELFYWSEDTEYLQNRIPRIHHVNPFRCSEALVHHLHHRSNKHPSWYYYYTVRNTIYYRTRIVNYTWPRTRRTIVMYAKFMVNILFTEGKKLRKFYLLIYGTYHGLSGKLGKVIDPNKNQ